MIRHCARLTNSDAKLIIKIQSERKFIQLRRMEKLGMYPYLTVDLNKIAKNVGRVTALCAQYGIGVTGVTKVVRGTPEIAGVMARHGVKALGDSRTENLERLAGLGMERWMIRILAVSEAPQVVENAEVSLNSDLTVLEALNNAALDKGKLHRVILMADLGDLREGFFDREELLQAASAVRGRMKGLCLAGIGVNLTCFSFVQSDTEKMLRLIALSRELGLPPPIVSGGNSATLDLMLRGGIPADVNNLRLGESLLFGRERARYRYLEGTENDAFLLRAEIVECREKPSLPVGTIGSDSYGHTPVFSDRGMRKRAICAVGRQSIDSETMWPVDPGVEILGASSDHLVLDVTDSEEAYRTGDLVTFRLGYFATMRAFTSPYVEKRYLPEL